MNDQDIIAFKSTIDENFEVIVVYSGYEKYPQFKSALNVEQENLAARVIGETKILVDGESLLDISSDQFKAIQAHEICHSILDHTGISEDEEIEADLAAIHLLLELGELEASRSLSERLLNKRGLDHQSVSLDERLSRKSLKLFTEYRKNLTR
jgi:hypothetical protein